MTTTDDKTPDPTPALLPPARLAEIRERYDAVEIAGPWEAGGPVSPAVASFDDSHYVFPTGDELGPICEASSKARADFIAHAATDTPALLAHIDALQAPAPDDGGEALGQMAWRARAFPSNYKNISPAELDALMDSSFADQSDEERARYARIGTTLDAHGYARGVAAGRSEGEARIATLTAQVAWWTADHARVASDLAKRDTEIARLTAALRTETTIKEQVQDELVDVRGKHRAEWERVERLTTELAEARAAHVTLRAQADKWIADAGRANEQDRLDGAREASVQLAAVEEIAASLRWTRANSDNPGDQAVYVDRLLALFPEQSARGEGRQG